MTQSEDHEDRISALEARIEVVAADALTARHLAAATDRDHASLGIKVDANRQAINALGLQTAVRFDDVDRRFDGVDRHFDTVETKMREGFTEIRQGLTEICSKLDVTTTGQQEIVRLLNTLMDRPDPA